MRSLSFRNFCIRREYGWAEWSARSVKLFYAGSEAVSAGDGASRSVTPFCRSLRAGGHVPSRRRLRVPAGATPPVFVRAAGPGRGHPPAALRARPPRAPGPRPRRALTQKRRLVFARRGARPGLALTETEGRGPGAGRAWGLPPPWSPTSRV